MEKEYEYKIGDRVQVVKTGYGFPPNALGKATVISGYIPSARRHRVRYITQPPLNQASIGARGRSFILLPTKIYNIDECLALLKELKNLIKNGI